MLTHRLSCAGCWNLVRKANNRDGSYRNMEGSSGILKTAFTQKSQVGKDFWTGEDLAPLSGHLRNWHNVFFCHIFSYLWSEPSGTPKAPRPLWHSLVLPKLACPLWTRCRSLWLCRDDHFLYLNQTLTGPLKLFLGFLSFKLILDIFRFFQLIWALVTQSTSITLPWFC